MGVGGNQRKSTMSSMARIHRHGEGDGTFHEVLGCPAHKQVRAMKRFGVDHGVVDDAEFPPVGQVDVEPRPVGHDLHAFDHAGRFC